MSKSAWMRAVGGPVLAWGLLASPAAQAQVHRTGYDFYKQCPSTAINGDTVTCTSTIRNKDDQHGVENMFVTNEILPPNALTSTAFPVECFECASVLPGDECVPGTAKPFPTTLAVTDGAVGGPDSMACTMDETVVVAQCVRGVENNRVQDRLSITGEDAGTPDEPNASTETGIIVFCCGDGVVNTPTETCDAPGDMPGDCPTCAPGTVSTCRADCTLCGDGVLNGDEVCDGAAFEPGAPVGHGACRAPTAGQVDPCTYCGDGAINGPAGEEACDGTEFTPGLPNAGNSCRVDCTYCGDGVKQTGEECDFNDQSDPNTQAGLCTETCQIVEICGDGIAGNLPGETCDGTDFVSPPPAGALECRPPGPNPDGGPIPPACTYCGDGIENDASETCDDGALASVTPYDGLCRGDVAFPGYACTACGDGVFQPGAGEECDASAPDGVGGNQVENCCDCQIHAAHVDKQLSCTGEAVDLLDVADYPVRVLDSCVSWENTTPPDPLLYRLCAINDSVTADLECTITDPKLGGTVLGPVTVLAGGESCVDITDFTCGDGGAAALEITGTNTATLVCNPTCPAVPPQTPFSIEDSDQVNLECQEPGLNVTKVCEPFEAPPGTNRDFTVTVSNTGTATLINCVVEDDGTVPGMCPEPDPIGGPVTLPPMMIPEILPGNSADVTFADLPINSDGAYACNTAWVQCEIYDPNTGGCVPDPNDPAECKLTEPVAADAECRETVELICRTPGFWGTHAEANPDKRGSQDITGDQLPITVCGVPLTNTEPNMPNSAQEALCVSVRGNKLLQLARQLTAARLNCKVSEGCPASVTSLLDQCDALCAAGDPSAAGVGSCIGDIDDFNNGISDLGPGCHDQPLPCIEGGPCYDPPGPAGSSKDCSEANKSTDCTIFGCP